MCVIGRSAALPGGDTLSKLPVDLGVRLRLLELMLRLIAMHQLTQLRTDSRQLAISLLHGGAVDQDMSERTDEEVGDIATDAEVVVAAHRREVLEVPVEGNRLAVAARIEDGGLLAGVLDGDGDLLETVDPPHEVLEWVDESPGPLPVLDGDVDGLDVAHSLAGDETEEAW